jgi:arylsulfatase A-like enzyme
MPSDNVKSETLFMKSLLAVVLGTLLPGGQMPLASASEGTPAARPNVLFIAIDDMNDGISLFSKNRPFKTPNLERLASRGVFFSRAYCSSPACNPSRASILTGKRPHRTGVYHNAADWRNACRNVTTLPEFFRQHSYHTESYGKIYHHHLDGAFNDPSAWDVFRKMDADHMPPAKLNRAPGYGTRNTDWGAWPPDDEESRTIDYKSVSYAIEVLKRDHKKPFFLASGIYKPHSPFFAPPRYHAIYSGGLDVPLRKGDDWQDLPPGARTLMEPTRWFWKGMMELEVAQPGSYQRFIEAYAACCSFSDASVGRLLDALDRSLHRDNTIVVLWSDHGFHLGEKDHIEKFALWEKATHVPLIIADPRYPVSAGKTCGAPVDLTVIYPTLVELCGLPPNHENDGLSVAAQVRDPARTVDRPALMTYGFNNHAVRTERWRYIRYSDGSEELYDHDRDPHEWHNLLPPRSSESETGTGDEALRSVVRELRQWIPTENARPCNNLQ